MDADMSLVQTAKSKRSKRIKNLEKEVALILAEDESEEEETTVKEEKFEQRWTRAGAKRSKKRNADTVDKNMSMPVKLPNSPSMNTQKAQAHEAPRSTARKSARPVLDYEIIKSANSFERKRMVLTELLNTPSATSNQVRGQESQRRSARKITRPQLDYDDIINKKPFSSEEADVNDTTVEEHPRRWNPTEVGRISSCRSRKSRRITVIAAPKELPEEEVPNEERCLPECNSPNDDLVIQKSALASKLEVSLDTIKAEAQTEDIEEFNKTATKVDVDKQILEPVETPVLPIKLESKEVHTKDSQVIIKPRNLETEKNFGKYLKPKMIDLADIGVQPLDLDEFDNGNEQVEEMPDLTVCDDMDILEVKEESNENPLNVTFETNETTIVAISSNEEIQETVVNYEKMKRKQPQSIFDYDHMQRLQFTDDDDENIEPTIKQSKENNVTTFVLTDTDQSASPKLERPRAFRFHTPYKSRMSFTFTKNTPQDIAERRTSKRSNSATISTTRSNRMVKFFSPANTTMGIDEMDNIISTKHARDKTHNESNITQRRKRSISLDEKKLKMSRLPKPTAIKPPFRSTYTPSKERQMASNTKKKLPIRTKLPNFAAIHKNNFNQMENLVDHVKRKAERAKVLTNSACKLPAAALSTQKKKTEDQPKALKRIDLAQSAIPRPQHQLLKSTVPLKQNPSHEVTNKSITVAKPNVGFVSKLKPLGMAKITQNASKPTMVSPASKMAERRQRHMDMYKGRSAANRNERQELIRGVRSNRRFELQMKYRRNIEEH